VFFPLLGLTGYCKKSAKNKAELESDPTTLDSNLVKLEQKYKVNLTDKKSSRKSIVKESRNTTTVPKVNLSELEEEAKPIKVLVLTTNRFFSFTLNFNPLQFHGQNSSKTVFR
jgi:hypothetical protein